MPEEWLSMGGLLVFFFFLVASFSNINEIQGFLMNYFVLDFGK